MLAAAVVYACVTVCQLDTGLTAAAKLSPIDTHDKSALTSRHQLLPDSSRKHVPLHTVIIWPTQFHCQATSTPATEYRVLS
jgi:hypothetical protein